MSGRLLQSWCYLWLLVEVVELVLAGRFSPVTQDVGLQNGQMAAFADFNADKATDILVLNRTTKHTTLFVYVWNHKQGQFLVNELRNFPLAVVAVSVADFDGDGAVDILALFEHGDCFSASIQWCHIEDNQVTIENSTTLSKNFSNQPLVVDANGDHIPDLFGLTCASNTFSFFISSETRSFAEQPLNLSASVEGRSPNSSYYVDLDSDCTAEIVLFYDLHGNRSLEVFKRDSKSNWRQLPSMSLPPQLQGTHIVVGEPAFADMNGDGILEMLVFSCNDTRCTQRAVHTLHQQWFTHDVLSCQGGGESWRPNFSQIITVNLTRSSNSSSHRSHTLPPRPVIGDLDLDGYPDVIVSVVNETGISLRPLILLGSGGRGGLHPQWDLLNDPAASNVTQTAFFDLWEDGVLDVLLVQGAGDGPGRLTAYKQSLSEDHTFLKVLALNGHCFSGCTSGIKPYGSVLPGTTVAFSTTDRNGKKERSTATVHSSSFSLQLPFVLFGLGETPNFIEDLTVAAGYGSNGSASVSVDVGYHKWSLLVPNSQVIVVMTPHNQPKKWYIELYLTPSYLVYNTAGVLCALSVGIAVIIILLQAREKYQDSKERKQAKHRFHFNAM